MNIKEHYLKSLTIDELTIKIGDNLSVLKTGINSPEIDFQESKGVFIETIEIAENHLLILQEKINELKGK